ncbi:MAG: hypothetical protein NUV74_14915 [Candidatus Brocadiaceae bacterium]|nr:hypothetical protein [Candidatus Brocadiaceae bacterium]
MELILDSLESLIYIYEEVFWLKECFVILKSLIVFVLVWWIVRLQYRMTLLLYLGTFIGVACIFFGDIGYWSNNDVLKLIAPASLFLLTYNKKQNNDALLFIFLIPYLITSYEFYRSFHYVIMSIVSHTLVISSIIVVKQNIYLSLFISAVIGITINSIDANSPPGTNDILLNPALITMAAKGLEFYTKDNRYTDFLKSFWATLLCFAYFGSWAFHYIKPGYPLYSH